MRYQCEVLFGTGGKTIWQVWTTGSLEDCLETFMEYRLPSSDFPETGHGSVRLQPEVSKPKTEAMF